MAFVRIGGNVRPFIWRYRVAGGIVLDGSGLERILDPESLWPLFKDMFRQLQRGKALEPFVLLDGCYLLSLDGTGYFSSKNIHCPSCLEKVSKSGIVTYSHQMLGAAIVHPDHKEVLPRMPEPIIKQDGATKNGGPICRLDRKVAEMPAVFPVKAQF